MSHDDRSCVPSIQFPTTAWTLIAEAQERLSGGQSDAMNRLLTKYWKPVFYFLRAKGYPLQQAEDLTQEFFLQFLGRDWIRRVDRSRGRFRTFLLTVLLRFLSDQGPSRGRRQATFENGLITVSGLMTEDDRSYEPQVDDDPQDIFFRKWAASLLDHALAEVRRQFTEEGHSQRFAIFEAACLCEAGQQPSQADMERQFGLTRDQVRYAIKQGKDYLCRQLRDELRSDGCQTDEIEVELGELTTFLAH